MTKHANLHLHFSAAGDYIDLLQELKKGINLREEI